MRLLLDTEPRQPRLWNRKIDRDLSTVCLKCLEKDPQRRYSSALALAEELEHWLKHEPILAKRSGFFTHTRKWVRRKPAIAALIAVLVALAAAIGWNVWNSELIAVPRPKEHRSASVRESKSRSRQRLFRGWSAGRNSNQPVQDRRSEGNRPHVGDAIQKRSRARSAPDRKATWGRAFIRRKCPTRWRPRARQCAIGRCAHRPEFMGADL